MMARFRSSVSQEPKPETPALLFRDLKSKDATIKFLWDHQAKLLDDYHKEALKEQDVAVELPTGSGKTLVGMLIGEFRRRVNGERVLYLCPNKQLCSQVSAQAQKYGISASLLIGKQKDYDTVAFSRYQQGKAIAISTYSGLFNNHPSIDDPQIIICDDAHAADGLVSNMWMLRVDRNENPEIFNRLYQALRGAIPEWLHRPIEEHSGNPADRSQVDLVTSILATNYVATVREAMEETLPGNKLLYPWRILADHLDACHIYCSAESIEIRPIIPPTLTHTPFKGANQRIYMSATLGENGDIERAFGIKKIKRLPIPNGWDKRSTGRRLVLFPNLSDDASSVIKVVLERADRSLVLVPHESAGVSIRQHFPALFQVIGPKDIEQSVKAFTQATKTILLLANRYDGLDLPGEDCRMLCVVELPAGKSLQERYLIEQLGAMSQFQDRIRTRVTQALGRCTREDGDYSVVLFVGCDLLKWCCTTANLDGMHPELQAEIRFGLQESEDRQVGDFVELAQTFLDQSDDWQQAEKSILLLRDSAIKKKDATTDKLAQAAPFEIDFIYKLWDGRCEEALKSAIRVTEILEGGADLMPYRSFWYELSAHAAFNSYKQTGNMGTRAAVVSNLNNAASSSFGLKWIGSVLAQLTGQVVHKTNEQPSQEWFSNLNSFLENKGLIGGRFERDVARAREQISSAEWKSFELGIEFLGSLLGAKVTRFTAAGKPDGFWLFEGYGAFVFEAKTMENANSGISMKTVGQAKLHEQTVRSLGLLPDNLPCRTIVVSQRTTLDKLAEPHAGDMLYMSHNRIVKIFDSAASAFKHVRATAGSSSPEVLRDNFVRVYKERNLFIADVHKALTEHKVADLPISTSN